MQAMSGKASAPLARDNDAVTIFAKEGKQPKGASAVKPTKKQAEPEQPEPAEAEQPAKAPEPT